MLGLFLAVRAFHFANVCRMGDAEVDLLLARYLSPHNRLLYGSQMEASIQCGLELFDRDESGHPANVGGKLREWLRAGDVEDGCTIITTETAHANNNALWNRRITTR